MTTTTWNDNDIVSEGSNNNPIKIIVPIMLVLGLILVGFWYWMSLQTVEVFVGDYIIDGYYDVTPAEIRIIEIVSGHAWQVHGSDQVSKAFECFGKYGSAKSFKTFGFKGSKGEFIPTSLWMCFDKETGDWYTMITTVFEKIGQNKVAKLITIYKVTRDIFPTIDSYIEHIVNKWGAVVLNYSLAAEKLFLQPK